jgi:arsenate reductase
MITIYHNPRCSKSRECLHLLEELDQPFTTIKYLDQPLNRSELISIIAKLQLSPIDVVRKKEQAWIDNYKGKTLSDDEIIDAMVKYPNLIERPIVVNGEKAIIARPADAIKSII